MATPRLDPHLVAEVAAWFAEREHLYRGAGMVGPRGVSHGGAQSDLLAAFGRDADWGVDHAALARVLGRLRQRRRRRDHGADDRRLRLRGDRPGARRRPPRGRRRGPRRVGRALRRARRPPRSSEEESFVHGDRGVLRWRFEWQDEDGAPGHVRGVDVLRFRDGKVCEKFSYVKG